MPPVPKPEHHRAPTFMKRWREYRGLTQQEAADRAEVSRTTILRIEKGEIPYNQDFLERLAHAYGCEVVDLLSLDPLKPDPPRLIYERLRHASPEAQKQALAILEAFLKSAA